MTPKQAADKISLLESIERPNFPSPAKPTVIDLTELGDEDLLKSMENPSFHSSAGPVIIDLTGSDDEDLLGST
jgi:hypothetical protein